MRVRTFVGFDNYVALFTDPNFISVLINNRSGSSSYPRRPSLVGLLVAILTDRLGKRRETVLQGDDLHARWRSAASRPP